MSSWMGMGDNTLPGSNSLPGDKPVETASLKKQSLRKKSQKKRVAKKALKRKETAAHRKIRVEKKKTGKRK